MFAGKERGLGGLPRVGPQAGLAQPRIPAALPSDRCEQPRLQGWEPSVMLRCRNRAVPATICGARCSSCVHSFVLPSQRGHASLLRKERVLWRERTNKCVSLQERSQRFSGRLQSCVARSTHPNSLWKELPRHQGLSCVWPNPWANKARLFHPPSQPLYRNADT